MTSTDILFIHNNFPAQFRNLASRLAAIDGLRVASIGTGSAAGLPGIPIERYSFSGAELGAVHPFARRFEIECRRAEQVMYAANALKASGFAPQLIYVHPGWGEALPLRVLFPEATICSYSEFYYAPRGTDVGFDKEFPAFGIDGETRVIIRNAANLLALADADFSIAPTHWQRSVFPSEFQGKIQVVHDGLDVSQFAPVAQASSVVTGGRRFRPEDEIVTFVSRNLEPYRGFHILMRSLPEVLRKRPNAQICILGGDKVSYGAAPTQHDSWRATMLTELGGAIDHSRVHFLGQVPYEDYKTLLRNSSAHVYYTYPFVLSWSMLEAMALGCLIIGSDTPPVAEVIRHGQNGVLAPFFDIQALSSQIIDALAHPEQYRDMRAAARQTIVRDYDFEIASWPRHRELITQFCPNRALTRALDQA